MKILQRYIGSAVLVHTVVILLILASILCLANLLKISDLLVKGMSPLIILKFMYFVVVSLLDFTIPMAILVATLLVFGRLSSDNEITAMRASGVGLRLITTPVLLLALAFTVLSLFLNSVVIPKNTYETRRLKAQAGVMGPEVLLEPGEFVEFPGFAVKIRSREGDFFRNISIYQYEGIPVFEKSPGEENAPPAAAPAAGIGEPGGKPAGTPGAEVTVRYVKRLTKVIMAKRARLETDPEQKICRLYLEDGSLDEYDLKNPMVSTRTTFGALSYPIDLSHSFAKAENVSKRTKDMTSLEILDRRRELIRAGADPGDICLLTTELHRRLAFSAASLSFVLIGIPLAITTHRGEKAIGMALSLAIFFVFYLFVLSANALDDQPAYYPWAILWAPNLIYAVLGVGLTLRYTRI